MAASFFFYDLETSGIDPRAARIMQFAGQRTDMDLKPVGEPVNQLIKLTPDVLPDPDAVLVTGITPQMTLADGITEAAFLKRFYTDICVPGTIFLGYNSVRFDDEFMRFLQYRNFYDAYRWQWCDNCSRWDLLDVVRMTRALRPEGITWPFASDGAATNRLELLTSVNGLDHENAHDALSDVQATIAVAKLIKTKQPKLFQFLLDMRDKRNVAALVQTRQPFVYTSGKYPGEFEKTTVAVMLAEASQNGGAVVYDLRFDPAPFAKLSVKQLAERLRWRKDRPADEPALPVKTLRYNKCPAVAPLSVLDAASRTRLKLDMDGIEANRTELRKLTDFAERVTEALASLTRDQQTALVTDEQTVDAQLYDGFVGDQDRARLETVLAAAPDELGASLVRFTDQRLAALLPLYKARNYPEHLTSDERSAWEAFCAHRLFDGGQKSRLASYFARLQTLAALPSTTGRQRYLLEELRLYGESLMPSAA
ncbi:MAG TPA: exodeoxyribonuclease I [Candidatus Saccharimonadales bacterium]|nr:exodeoxyribonuclease I [Candidatus Saccharimonadales bacterium]